MSFGEDRDYLLIRAIEGDLKGPEEGILGWSGKLVDRSHVTCYCRLVNVTVINKISV